MMSQLIERGPAARLRTSARLGRDFAAFCLVAPYHVSIRHAPATVNRSSVCGVT